MWQDQTLKRSKVQTPKRLRAQKTVSTSHCRKTIVLGQQRQRRRRLEDTVRRRHYSCRPKAAPLSPMEFMGRLAALVPRPRVNLTRFHGVFSPNSKLRKDVVPQKPVEEQENPKPKAYLRPGRVRMGAAPQACVRH